MTSILDVTNALSTLEVAIERGITCYAGVPKLESPAHIANRCSLAEILHLARDALSSSSVLVTVGPGNRVTSYRDKINAT